MIGWMCGVSLKDRKTSKELRKLVGVQPITTVTRSGRLIWYGYVMMESDEDWVKRYMECGLEGGILVGRLRMTWLESVEADMAELEIDSEYVHDRKKMEKECYEEEVQPSESGR